MDEPSAVLGEKDLENLFAVVRQLQANGIGIIYISHRLKEIFALADRIAVLYEGRIVGEVDPQTTSRATIGLMMAGTPADQALSTAPHTEVDHG